MTTEGRAYGPVPLYAKVLRLRRLRVGGLVSFLCVECTVAAAILLALAELVSWWAVPILPALVAVVVKINDLVAAPARPRETARVPSGATEHAGFFPVNPPHTAPGGRHDTAERPRYDWPAEEPGGAPVNARQSRVTTQRSPVHADADTARRGAATSSSGRHAALPEDPPPPAPDTPAGPANVPGAGAPERARIIGAAVRRSMAMQAQFGSGPVRGTGRHARQDADITTRRRSGMNTRHYDRSA